MDRFIFDAGTGTLQEVFKDTFCKKLTLGGSVMGLKILHKKYLKIYTSQEVIKDILQS